MLYAVTFFSMELMDKRVAGGGSGMGERFESPARFLLLMENAHWDPLWVLKEKWSQRTLEVRDKLVCTE